jgi:hypothetical protein
LNVYLAGHSSHPFTTLRAFFNEYPYICNEYFIALLTGTTFTNHAPTAPAATSKQLAASLHRKTHAGTAQHMRQSIQSAAAAAASRTRYANSGDVTPEIVAAQGLNPWQACTLVATLRDVRAGEELLEDYTPYNTPCSHDNDCPEFMQQQQQRQTAGKRGEQAASSQQPQEEWNRAVLVQTLDTYVGSSSSSSSSSGPGGGLGVFAARDLPAGTVWNKEDAAHALTVTRWGEGRLCCASVAGASPRLLLAVFDCDVT